MPHWPTNESPTGRGFVQGSDSYSPADVAREERERRKVERRKLLPPGGIDFDADPADDPNFGDYNTPPGRNHP